MDNSSISPPTFPDFPKEENHQETSNDDGIIETEESEADINNLNNSTIENELSSTPLSEVAATVDNSNRNSQIAKKRILKPNVINSQSKSSLAAPISIQKVTSKKKRTASSLSTTSSTSVLSGPFRIPNDNEIFAIRDQQRKEKLEYQESLKGTKCYLRGLDLLSDGTSSSLSSTRRSNFRYMTQLPPPKVSAENEALAQLILSPDSNQSQEGLRDFIDQKREIFLAQLSIETKREELQRLERLEREEEENLQKREAEINLFKDQFRSFLEADGKLTMDKRREAEQKSKQRLEVSLRIKQISTEISSLRNEIAHYEEKYKECEGYKDFLESLTPSEWREAHPFPELYFTKPEQLIEILEHLENQNMFLIRHCQDAEEAVERIKSKFNELLEERDRELLIMTEKKEMQDKRIEEMKERNEQYKYEGEFHHINELPPSELKYLISSITDFHNKLGFDEAATGDTSTMLKRIEVKMEELNRSLAKIDQRVVRDMAQDKARKRRDLERLEKAAKKQKEQEEKTLKALQLAKMPQMKKTGRPLMPKSLPIQVESREKREEKMRIEQARKEADHNLLFGPIWD
ncbi:Cilia- and flagella-associated protein 100 [Tritrichomonas musculus]|uniref:Cilia- and flagella-associated protein 100 n=1 Tax=Tritrichomonas musculus TaxID=1915356 RepID=A0ABR2KL00_9EUKA